MIYDLINIRYSKTIMKIFTSFILSMLVSCSTSTDKTMSNALTLCVDLNSPQSDYTDVFDKIEVIPLETTDNSLIVHPKEIIEFENRFYIYDIHTQKVFLFSDTGEFICTIGGKGQGPGEYAWIASIALNKTQGEFQILEPWGSFSNYTLEGKFINRKNISASNPNYNRLFHLDDKLVTWSIPADDESNAITIIDSHTTEALNRFSNGPRVIKSMYSKMIYSYSNKLYYAQTLESNNVYEITTDSLKIAYKWDFGKDNFNIYDLNLTLKDKNQEREAKLIEQYIEDKTIPYWIPNQQQNKDYYYACLNFGLKYDMNLFYHKTTNKYFVLGGEGCDIQIRPLVFTDDYMICNLFQKDYVNFKPLLPEAERKKLEALTEDDNPCLLKLYFKK